MCVCVCVASSGSLSPLQPGACWCVLPGTCILFGDGCGAVLLSAAPDGAPCGLLGVDMHSDGSGQKSLHAMYSGGGGKPFQARCVFVERDGGVFALLCALT